MRAKTGLLGAVLASVALCASPRPAAATPDESAPLGAIDADLARDAAERIACASPKARRYFARTLRNVQQRRWGVVRASLEDDTIDLVGDAVYEAALRGDGRGEALARFVAGGKPAEACTAAELAQARAALERADHEPTPSEVDHCAGKRISERRKDPACALAIAVRAAMDDEFELAQASVADLVATATFAAIAPEKALSSAQEDMLFEHVALALRGMVLAEDDEPTIVEDVAEAFKGLDLDEVHPERCKDEDLVKVLAAGAVDSQDAFCAATRSDLALDKIRVTLKSPSGKSESSDLASLVHVVHAFEHGVAADQAQKLPTERDERVAEALLCSLPFDPADRAIADCATGSVRSARAGAFELTIGERRWSIKVSGRGDGTRLAVTSPDHASLSALVSGAMEAADVRADVEALIRFRLLGQDVPPTAVRPLAATALRLQRVAAALDRLPAEADHHAVIVGVVEALPALPYGRPVGTCDAPATPVERIVCAARPGGSLRPLLVAAEEGRIRDLAVRTTSLLTPGGDAAPCSRNANARLLVALSAYVSDEREIDPLAAQQLSGVAHDLARCANPARDRALDSGFELLPSPALHASWNNAYLNAWGSDGFRLAPSLDLLAARVRLTPRSAPAYVGLRASLVDLAAPVVELAMRRADLAYDRQGAPVARAATPSRRDRGLPPPPLAFHAARRRLLHAPGGAVPDGARARHLPHGVLGRTGAFGVLRQLLELW